MNATLSLAWVQERGEDVERLMRAAAQAPRAEQDEQLAGQFATVHARFVEDGYDLLRELEAGFPQGAEGREFDRASAERRGAVSEWWSFVATLSDIYAELLADLRAGLPRLVHGRFTRVGWESVAALEGLSERLREIAGVAVVTCPDSLRELIPARLTDSVRTVRISPFAYLRAMFNLLWSAIRHPFSETTVDLSTGRVLYRT